MCAADFYNHLAGDISNEDFCAIGTERQLALIDLAGLKILERMRQIDRFLLSGPVHDKIILCAVCAGSCRRDDAVREGRVDCGLNTEPLRQRQQEIREEAFFM